MRLAHPALRARGAQAGRGPQIGPGTLIGYTAPSEEDAPGPLRAVVFADGSGVPEEEHWCFLTGANWPGFEPIVNGACLWLDQVPAGAAFQAPVDPGDLGAALKQYAVTLYKTRHAQFTATSDWSVRTSRQVDGGPPVGSSLKISDGIYRVWQRELPIGSQLQAWVWVSGAGAHEVWVYHRPSEANGFRFVGMPDPATGLQHVYSRLVFQSITPAVQLSIANYAASVAALKYSIVTTEPQCPTSSTLDLVDHHHRVRAWS